MKLIKIIYVAHSLIIATLTIALLGAGGHKIFVLDNAENMFFLFNALAFLSVALVDIVYFFIKKGIKVNPFLFKSLHVLAILLKVLLIVKLLPFPSAEDFPKPLIIFWISALIVFDVYLIGMRPAQVTPVSPDLQSRT